MFTCIPCLCLVTESENMKNTYSLGLVDAHVFLKWQKGLVDAIRLFPVLIDCFDIRVMQDGWAIFFDIPKQFLGLDHGQADNRSRRVKKLPQ